MEYEKKFNVNDYYLKDVAYELKSHPDYIFRQELVINKPKHCDDYNVPFVNLLQLSNIPKQFFQQYELIKEKYNELNLNMMLFYLLYDLCYHLLFHDNHNRSFRNKTFLIFQAKHHQQLKQQNLFHIEQLEAVFLQ